MMRALQLIAANLDSSVGFIIFFICILGGIIFYSRDYKIGLIIQLVIMVCLFMWFWNMGWDYRPPLLCVFITVVFLALSIYANAKTAEGFI